MEVGIILGDVPTEVDGRDHLHQLLAQVRAAERSGIRLISIGQHFLYGDHRWLQPIPTLARLAAEVAPETRLATTVLLLPLLHPVALAEDLATLDIVTDGRLIAGFGLGYRREEFAAFGVPFDERVPRFEEALEVVTRMWTEDHVEHAGRFFTVDGRPHVRPVQAPRPPIWIGAQGPPGIRRATRLGDAWPIGPTVPAADLPALIELYRAERTRLGLPAEDPLPIRRDVSVGRDRRDALDRFLDLALDRYRVYEAKGQPALGGGPTPAGAVAGHLVHGDEADVVAQMTDLAQTLNVGPVIVRPHWPGMDARAIIDAVERLAPVVAALAGV